jgi:hypothetical protein
VADHAGTTLLGAQDRQVLNKLPNSLHGKAKRALHDIWMAETRNGAEAAFAAFIETYGRKYDKAVECLIKDRDRLLAFYDFPAEHWRHLRTTNPIESAFATVLLPKLVRGVKFNDGIEVVTSQTINRSIPGVTCADGRDQADMVIALSDVRFRG